MPTTTNRESETSGPELRRVAVDDVEFALLEWLPRGESRGLVLASHGFPDHAWTYRLLGPTFAEAGYRVVAPFLRGYAPSAITKGPFHPLAIAHDLVGLAEELRTDDESLFLVGHDWGAAASYLAAAALGDRVSALATLAVPHGGGFFHSLVSDPEQQRRSWYMFFFQLPLAEQAVAHDDFAFIERLWTDWSPGWPCPRAWMEELKQTFRQPGVVEAALGYYRDTFHPPPPEGALAEFAPSTQRPIASPCLYLHGRDDGCIGIEIAEGMEAGFSSELERQVINRAGHFLHLERPNEIHRRILDFFMETC